MENQSNIVLKVNNLSKVFQVSENIWGDTVQKNGTKEFNAIKNLSFEIKKGEVCGLVGRNGSGKTTLLQLISGIIKPSGGEIIISGKTASIIDIGSGMHRDLSGLENIFLAGELLGMSKIEIEEKLPEIISFSELQNFLQLPVKHYSSGMFMRLAFSVVTHLNADILLIDEVIGVGDMAFAEKTTDRIMKVCKQGKSAIIATHSLPLIRACCDTAMYLKNGALESKAEIDKVQELYVEDVLENKSLLDNTPERSSPFKPKLKYRTDETSTKNPEPINLVECSIRAIHHSQNEFSLSDDLSIDLAISAKVGPCIVSVHVNFQYNQPAICLVADMNQTSNLDGNYKLTAILPAHTLNQGLYTVSVFFVDENDTLITFFENILIFKTTLPESYKTRFGYLGQFSGPVFKGGDWTIQKV